MSEMNESMNEIIKRAKSGDREAFDTLHEMYVTPVYRYVLMRLHNVDDTEDVVQETFMKAYQAIDRYEDEGKGMLPYLFTIARNLLINHTKKKRPETFLPEEMDRHAGGESASAGAILGELTSALRKAMEALSALEREAVELKFFGERTYAEIAVIMGKREDAIRQHIARSMKKLRVIMRETE
jgi:RNA polymerase sigma-70 factor (ECF subfamily)